MTQYRKKPVVVEAEQITEKIEIQTREESVPVGPVPIRNYPLAKMTADQTVQKYGVALLWSNGSEDRPADQWFVRRVLH